MTRILLAWWFLAYAPYQSPVVVGPFSEWGDCIKISRQWEKSSQYTQAWRSK